MIKRYKKAFQCKSCPGQNGENGCPLWWKQILENKATGQVKVEENCGFVLLPVLILETVKAANGAQAQINLCQNEVNDHSQIIFQGFQRLVEIAMKEKDADQIENGSRSHIQALSDR